ncbi:MAG TPA: YceI family protein [Thiobacillus sp.]
MKLTFHALAVLALLASPAASAVEYRTVLPAQSAIGFEFNQMGVSIKGGFKRFVAQLIFDPAKPEAARAQIDIDLASIDAGSSEADEESAGRLWFNSSVYPRAQFVSSQVRPLGNNRYEMRGKLMLKGRSREMAVPVTFKPGKTAATFEGAFVLKRLDFGIGEGMWADVATVANEVQVTFRITATGT